MRRDMRLVFRIAEIIADNDNDITVDEVLRMFDGHDAVRFHIGLMQEAGLLYIENSFIDDFADSDTCLLTFEGFDMVGLLSWRCTRDTVDRVLSITDGECSYDLLRKLCEKAAVARLFGV